MQTILTDVRALVDERPILLSGWRDEFAQSVRDAFESDARARASAHRRLSHRAPAGARTDAASHSARRRRERGPRIRRTLSTAVEFHPRLRASVRALSRRVGDAATPADALAATFPASTAASDDGGLDDARVMCASARDVLLRWYVEQSAQSIGFMIRKSLTAADWAKTREPRDVRPLADYVADRLSIVERECAQILDVGDAAEDAAEDDDGRVSATQTSVARAASSAR